MVIVPTLLVGLGGIGSLIADRVYGMVPIHMRERVGIHAFDTNVNDISKLAHLGDTKVTQTSAAWSVKQYLHQTDDSVKDWFPYESPEILRKLLTEGAGQVRAVSRLAYRASIEDGKLKKLEDEITRLLRVSGDGLTLSLRIMIVSSLAGGTGAGLFLQTALFLQDLVRSRYKKENVLIRGAFILPDILTSTNTLDEREWKNVRSNAYACLKELNAVMGAALSGGDGQGITIELEYKPNQVDERGRKDHAIPEGMIPYEFIFLFDYENASGENIGCFENYLDQVVNTTYLQLFSPISGEMYSEEDNQIRELARQEGMSRFCGAGISRLVYPYSEILRYCALRWVTDSLSGKWLKLDHLYEEELKAYQRDIKNGIYSEKPEIHDRYPTLLEGLATGEKPDRFFRLIHNSLHTVLEQGQLGVPKHEKFLSALENEITRLTDLEASRYAYALDEGKLKIKKHAANEIATFEGNLIELHRLAKEFVSKSATFLLQKSVFQDYDEPSSVSGEECRLNTWILSKSEPLHPVGVRSFLFALFGLIDRQIKELAARNEELEKQLKAYDTTFDDTDTEQVESAEDRVRAALNKKFYKTLFKNDFKEIIEEYQDKASRQQKRINEYRITKLKEVVYTKLREQVAEMNMRWKIFFGNLEVAADALLSEQLRLQTRHDNSPDPTVKYVFAGKDLKARCWEALRNDYAAEEIPTDIARTIYVGQYKRFCGAARGERVLTEDAERTLENFSKDVLDWCHKKLDQDGRLDMDIITALRREAELLYPSWDQTRIDEYIGQEVKSLVNLAQPFAPITQRSAHMRKWGINGVSIGMLSQAQVNELFTGKENVDDAFSSHEIICYHSVYGLTASDFPKFYAGDEIKQPGVYFRAYHDIITILNTKGHSKEITPHLDKRWHLPAYMPDLNAAAAEQDRKRINRAFILGKLYEILAADMEDGRLVWIYYGANGQETVKARGRKVDGVPCALHGALRFNPSVVDRVLADVQVRMDKDRRRMAGADRLAEHGFVKGMFSEDHGMLDWLYAYPEGEPGDERLPMIINKELRPLLLDEITDYCALVFGRHQTNLANGAATDLMRQMISSSKRLAEAVDRDSYANSWKRYIEDRIEKLNLP